MSSLCTHDMYTITGGNTMSTLVHIYDAETFSTYRDVLDGDDYKRVTPPIHVSYSTKQYGIFNERFGWIKDVHVDIVSGELQIGFTPKKEHALSIEGRILKGRILTWGQYILV